jgi:hypothetical protein
MTPEERRMVAELADEMFTNDRGSALVAELAGADAVWEDAAAMAALFELQGRRVATSTLLDLAVLRLPAGEPSTRFMLPPLGLCTPPGKVTGGQIVVDGVLVAGGGGDRVIVGTDSDDLLVIPGSALDFAPITGFDPLLGLTRVSGTVTLGQCGSAPAGHDWTLLVVRASRALAHELLGVCRAVLETATLHVQQRIQFGRPIGAFQAVRHRLADALVAETGSRELLAATDESLPAEWQVVLLKAQAGRAALLAVQSAQQVCGAMGFTEEFGLHRYVRRAYVLDSLFGGSEAAEVQLGALAVDTGRTPDRLITL